MCVPPPSSCSSDRSADEARRSPASQPSRRVASRRARSGSGTARTSRRRGGPACAPLHRAGPGLVQGPCGLPSSVGDCAALDPRPARPHHVRRVRHHRRLASRDARRGRGRTGGVLPEERFDEVVDAQGRLSQATPGRPYREIVAESLVEVAGPSPAAAAAIGAAAGRWPLFPDSAAALARLLRIPRPAPRRRTRTASRQPRAASARVRARPARPPLHRIAADHHPRRRRRDSPTRDDIIIVAASTTSTSTPPGRPGPADVVVPDLAALAQLLERT